MINMINGFMKKLNTTEKQLVKRVVSALNLDVDTNSKEDDDYKKEFEILVGEMNAGNTNPQIKNKLKQYITDSLESAFTPRRQAFQLLFELSNA